MSFETNFRETVMLFIHRHLEKRGKPFNGTLIALTLGELKERLRILDNAPGLTDSELDAEIGRIVKKLVQS